jgi:membrane fusion protein, multidrug efflux system
LRIARVRVTFSFREIKYRLRSFVRGSRYKGANVDRGRRRILVHCAVAIAIGGTGAWYLHQGPEPVRAARSSASAVVPVAVATKRDLPVYLTPLGSVQAFFTVGIEAQVDGKLEEVLLTAEQGSPAE